MRPFSRALAVVSAAVLSASTSVYAAIPAGVDTAITGYQTDGLDLIETLAVAGAAVLLLAALLKRFGLMPR